MPAQVNITVENDQDFYQVFQYTLADGITPVSLVGATFNMGVRRSAGDTGLLFRVTSTVSTSGQISLFDAPNGKFQIWIAKAALLAAPLGSWSQSLIANLQAAGAQPAISVPIWGASSITINPGPSR